LDVGLTFLQKFRIKIILDGLAALTSFNSTLDETGLADAEVRRTAIAIGTTLGTMWLANVSLMFIQNVARVALALIVSNADTIQTGHITVG